MLWKRACLGDVVDIVRGDAGHGDAPVAREVDRVLGAQPLHVLLRPARARPGMTVPRRAARCPPVPLRPSMNGAARS